MLELSSTELDLVVLGQIAAGLFAAELQGNMRGVHAKHDQERTYSAFRYHGQPICLKMFRFLHTIGTKRYSNLLKHYRTHGVPPRTHGNEKQRPWNAADYADKERAIAFIKSYADVHAMPLPGRLPKHQDYKVMLLPSNVTKRLVYNDYCTASKELTNPQGGQIRIFSYRESGRLWAETVPYIAVMLPASDFCLICQENTNAIMHSTNQPEDVKSQRLKEAEAHLAQAKAEHSYYCDQVDKSRKTWSSLGDMDQSTPNSRNISLHLSFDYTQQIHYPHNPFSQSHLI